MIDKFNSKNFQTRDTPINVKMNLLDMLSSCTEASGGGGQCWEMEGLSGWFWNNGNNGR